VCTYIQRGGGHAGVAATALAHANRADNVAGGR
jgi:hypothetical protein